MDRTQITVYCHPRCSTCKKALAWLDDHGVSHEVKSIIDETPFAQELKTWIGESGLPLRRFFNTSGTRYRELGVKAMLDDGMDVDEACALLASDGMLIKRPLLVGDGLVLVGFKEMEWERALLG